jgi:hypothetical protein
VGNLGRWDKGNKKAVFTYQEIHPNLNILTLLLPLNVTAGLISPTNSSPRDLAHPRTINSEKPHESKLSEIFVDIKRGAHVKESFDLEMLVCKSSYFLARA